MCSARGCGSGAAFAHVPGPPGCADVEADVRAAKTVRVIQDVVRMARMLSSFRNSCAVVSGLCQRAKKRTTDFPLTDPLIPSVNEWTAIEPTRRADPTPLPNPEAYTEGYPHEDFGTAYLEVVRDRLGDRAHAVQAGAVSR